MERQLLKKAALATGVARVNGESVCLLDPKISWGAVPLHDAQGKGWLGIATGGTGGVLKVVRHDEETLGAAVDGFQKHFSLTSVNAVDILPPYHVSGFMSRVRAALTGGRYVSAKWKQVENGDFPEEPGRRDTGWVISLVPTQLRRLLDRGVAAQEWLRRFQVIFLGGGPAWPSLLAEAREAGLRISLCYGMTESAAMVTALKPESFLAGASSCGTALPHAKVSITEDGVVALEGPSLFRGYAGGAPSARPWLTEDLGVLDASGNLSILGRRDDVLITGGLKVSLSYVEGLLRDATQIADLAAFAVTDPEWGQSLVAAVKTGTLPPLQALDAKLVGVDGLYRPKRWVEIPVWPVRENGKIDRVALKAQVVVA